MFVGSEASVMRRPSELQARAAGGGGRRGVGGRGGVGARRRIEFLFPGEWYAGDALRAGFVEDLTLDSHRLHAKREASFLFWQARSVRGSLFRSEQPRRGDIVDGRQGFCSRFGFDACVLGLDLGGWAGSWWFGGWNSRDSEVGTGVAVVRVGLGSSGRGAWSVRRAEFSRRDGNGSASDPGFRFDRLVG